MDHIARIGKMKNCNLIKQLRNYVLAGSLGLAAALSPTKASADDILKGVRGPTSWQLDDRLIHSENNKEIKSVTNNLILKYWDGDELGKWGFINIPYKFTDTSKGDNKGIGDITIAGGPRFKINDFHGLSFLALTLPTGDSEDKIPLGNGRYDIRIGLFGTYLKPKFELDGSLEYVITGENKKGINPPNELNLGALIAIPLNDYLKFGVGPKATLKQNGDYLLNTTFAFRYTDSKKVYYIQFFGDIGLKSDNIPKGNNFGLRFGVNF